MAGPPRRAVEVASRLGVGGVALVLMLVAVLRLRGLTIDDYLAARDPVSETVYYLSLGVFAVMPLLLPRQ